MKTYLTLNEYTFDDPVVEQLSTTRCHLKGAKTGLPFDTIIEHFNLFCIHGEYPIECKAIFLGSGGQLSGSQLNSLEAVIKRHNNLTPFV